MTNLYRSPDEESFKNYGSDRTDRVTIPNEWDSNHGVKRYEDPAWVKRYTYEAGLICEICNANGYANVLELGSGPGKLGQIVQQLLPNVKYTFVDKLHAYNEFKHRGFSGQFYVKDLMNGFDIEQLGTRYDMVIANDFLEHVANPSDILFKLREITTPNAAMLVSVPNWRMGHTFIYRGLFDYDNWVYFSKVHGWPVDSVAPSILTCRTDGQFGKLLDSESTMQPELMKSWNWYFVSYKHKD